MTSPDQTSSRRALSRRARDAFPPMGVYAIRDHASGRVHVKSSPNVTAALDRIRFELRHGTHRDPALQAAWTRAGAQGVSFEVIELIRRRDDPAFDYAEELRVLEHLYREELALPKASA